MAPPGVQAYELQRLTMNGGPAVDKDRDGPMKQERPTVSRFELAGNCGGRYAVFTRGDKMPLNVQAVIAGWVVFFVKSSIGLLRCLSGYWYLLMQRQPYFTCY